MLQLGHPHATLSSRLLRSESMASAEAPRFTAPLGQSSQESSVRSIPTPASWEEDEDEFDAPLTSW